MKNVFGLILGILLFAIGCNNSNANEIELWNGFNTKYSKSYLIQYASNLLQTEPLREEENETYILFDLYWPDYPFDHVFSSGKLTSVRFHSSLPSYDQEFEGYYRTGNVRLFFFDNQLICVTVCFSSDVNIIRHGLESKYGKHDIQHNSSSFTSIFYLYTTNDLYVVNSGKQVSYFDRNKWDNIVNEDIMEQHSTNRLIF